jgi:hypothetical protein
VVGRWIALVIDTLKGPTPHPRRMAILISLFHAGPWMLVAVAIFSYFEYSERWARLLGVGIIVWAVFAAYFMLAARANAKKRKAENRDAA